MDHGRLQGQQVHSVVALTYATEAARTGALGLTAADIGKVARQEDTGEHWVLLTVTPTWRLLGLPGGADTIPPVALDPGDDPATLYTIAIAASRDIDVVAELKCSADDGVAGKRLRGSVVCTAKRYGTNALVVTSQSAALPWVCDDALWLPQFVPVGNSLLLQVTPDPTSVIQVRGRIRYELTDTSGDAPPPAHNSAWLLAQVQAGVGSKLLGLVIPADFTVSGSDVTVATTAYGPAIAVRAARPQVVTVGTRRYLQFARNSANTLYNTTYGTIREAVYLLNTPDLPFTSSESGFIISSNDYNYAFGQASTNTSNLVNTAATEYVNGVATTTLTESAQVVAVSYGANTSGGLEIGGLNAFGSFGFLEGQIGPMVFCNAALTTGERQAVEAALATYQAG